MYMCAVVLKRFLDIDHLISLLVTVPKRDTHRTAENTIANVGCQSKSGVIVIIFIMQVIYLKHILQLVDPLREVLEGTSNTLLKAFHQVSLLTLFGYFPDSIYQIFAPLINA